MVTVNTIEPPTVIVISPNGETRLRVNEYEFNDLRIQIKKQKVEGWTVEDTVHKTISEIDTDGRLADFPKSFHLFEDQLMEIAFG